MRVLVTGSEGRVASGIKQHLGEDHEFVYLDREDAPDVDYVADIADYEAIRPAFDGVERLPDAGVDLVAGQAEVLRPERHVRSHGGADEAVPGVLEHHPDARASGHEVLGDGRPVHEHIALVGLQEAVEVPDERRLPGAVRARDEHALAVRDVEADAVDGHGVAVPVDEVPDRQHQAAFSWSLRVMPIAAAILNASAGMNAAAATQKDSTRPTLWTSA